MIVQQIVDSLQRGVVRRLGRGVSRIETRLAQRGGEK
jgi:hypothetical protein